MSDRPSVCVVTHPLGSAGENATRTLLNVLGAITSVSLITAALDPDSTIWDDHEVIEISRHRAGDGIFTSAFRFFVFQLWMCREIVRRDEEMILFFGATSYLLPVIFSRAIGRTVLVEPRGDVPLTLRLHWETRVPSLLARVLAGSVRALERANFQIAHAVITYTPSMAEQLRLEPDSSKVYPDGARYVDTDQFDVQIPYDERETVVGFLGRLDEEKGIRELAQVARELPDDVVFRFIGDGGLSNWLAKELASEIAMGHVELTGWVNHDNVPTELNGLRLLVLPSQPTEGLPTTILESLACGTPVYATPVSGVPDVVRDGETGFLMRDRTLATITRDIERILRHENLETVSANGHKLVQSEYSFNAAVDRYDSILQSIESSTL